MNGRELSVWNHSNLFFFNLFHKFVAKKTDINQMKGTSHMKHKPSDQKLVTKKLFKRPTRLKHRPIKLPLKTVSAFDAIRKGWMS